MSLLYHFLIQIRFHELQFAAPVTDRFFHDIHPGGIRSGSHTPGDFRSGFHHAFHNIRPSADVNMGKAVTVPDQSDDPAQKIQIHFVRPGRFDMDIENRLPRKTFQDFFKRGDPQVGKFRRISGAEIQFFQLGKCFFCNQPLPV